MLSAGEGGSCYVRPPPKKEQPLRERKITQRLHPGAWLALHSARKEQDSAGICMLRIASLFYKPPASFPGSQSVPSQLDYITKWSQLQTSTKSCCLIWVQRNTLHLVIEANEGRQLRRQEQCSCAGLGLQGHPQPPRKRKRDWTENPQCRPCWASQSFRDLFETILSTPVPPSPADSPPHTRLGSLQATLFYFSFPPSCWEVAAGIKKASGKSSVWKRHAEKRAD